MEIIAYLNIAHGVFLAGVVDIIPEVIVGIVNGLVLAIGNQFLFGEVPLDCVRTPVPCCATRSAILVGDDLAIPPELDKSVAQNSTMAASIAVVI